MTWGELRAALWLNVVCAVTAALLAVPAGAAEFLVDDLTVATFGKGLSTNAAFRDEARMERHEPSTVDFDWGTPAARGQNVLASVWKQAVALFFFPVCYVAYLGSCFRVFCLAFGSVALAFTVASAGFVLSEKTAFLKYSIVLGSALLTVALKLLCPRGFKIPTQAIRQALVVMVGSLLVTNVVPETTVVLRLTAPERDGWIKRVLTKFCCAARVRRGTTLMISSVVPSSQSQPSSVLAKSFSVKSFALRRPDASERVAAAHERDAVVKQFHARMILVDMWAEYAGIYIGTVVLLLVQSNSLCT